MPRPVYEWIITDTHFNHKAISDSGMRPDGFTDLVISNMRRLIAPQDFLIHLGDVIFYDAPSLKGILDSIPCRKVLTIGNHDKQGHRWYMRNGFDWACDVFTQDGIAYSHKPLRILPDGCKINIHGHFHNNDHRSSEPQYAEFYDPAIHKKLAIEETNYCPVKIRGFLEKC